MIKLMGTRRTRDRSAMELRWTDRVYGDVSVDDPGVLALIACPTFQRLKGIRQAGPSALAFPFKTVTRYEHSLGVYTLLAKLGADRSERIAGLLHDISHTAFSHAVDFVFASEEQDHHEGLKPEFLCRPDITKALRDFGFEPSSFFDDSVYPLLEQPLPRLCADRLDYFFRDSLACGVSTPEQVDGWLASLTVVGTTIAFTSEARAAEAAERFAAMNQDWWAGPTEAYIYNEFAEALQQAFRLRVLTREDLFEDDAHVLERLATSSDPRIAEPLGHVLRFRAERALGYQPRVLPKTRWLDPPVLDRRGLSRLSERVGRTGISA